MSIINFNAISSNMPTIKISIATFANFLMIENIIPTKIPIIIIINGFGNS